MTTLIAVLVVAAALWFVWRFHQEYLDSTAASTYRP
jgi:predicted negative regulator of RcsB-dependent stress response